MYFYGIFQADVLINFLFRLGDYMGQFRPNQAGSR